MLLCAFACCPLDVGIDRSDRARAIAARAQIENFKVALNAYRQDVGDYPSTAEGLHALRVSPGHPGWDGPYMPQDIPRDPWDVPYAYVYEGGRVQITASRIQ